jgi:hypothetical protein
MDQDEIVTEADVDEINRSALDRSAAIGRLGGSVLVVIGVVGALTWLWLTVKQQMDASDLGFSGGFIPGEDEAGPTLADRVTLFSSYFGLLLSASVAFGLGLLLRMLGDYGQIEAGGSITGLAVGDDLPIATIDLDEDAGAG